MCIKLYHDFSNNSIQLFYNLQIQIKKRTTTDVFLLYKDTKIGGDSVIDNWQSRLPHYANVLCIVDKTQESRPWTEAKIQ